MRTATEMHSERRYASETNDNGNGNGNEIVNTLHIAQESPLHFFES
jgi:hypothetical protein